MNLLNRHRLQIFLLFTATLFFAILMGLSFWNHSIRNDVRPGIWPLVFLILAIISFTLAILTFRRGFSMSVIEGLIEERVNAERSILLAEFEKKDEEVINKEDNVEDIVKKIMPKGNIKNAAGYAEKLLKGLSDELQVSIGIAYLAKGKKYAYLAGFALTGDTPPDFKEGENLNGQAALSKEILIAENIPEDYFNIESGLGKSKPKTLIIVPLLHKNKTVAILEIATFIESDDKIINILNKVSTQAAEKLVQLQKS